MAKKDEHEAHEMLERLQLAQQRMQLFAAQKQQIQMQLAELENALKEIGRTDKPVFRLIGELLVEKDKAELTKDLSDKKEDFEVRLKSLEKQEGKLKGEATDLQKELSEKIK